MDSKLMKHKAFPKPSLLQDYLMDDMSSCSSNGFKSFPRRQCCPATVRFLAEIDLNQQRKYFLFKKLNPSKSAVSAFHRVIAAIKRPPFASPEKNGPRKPIRPRNLAKKILSKSIFWKRKSSHKEIQRLKSFDQLLKEDSPPLDVPNGCIMTNCSSNFTASDACSTGNSSSEVNLNFTEVKRKEDEDDDDMVEALKNGDVSADSTTGSATKSSTEKQRSVSEEKEQFSPVSVLGCPFDDDEEVSSPFQHIQGSRKPKIERFGCHAAVEPLNLSKRFECTESPVPHSSVSSMGEEAEDEDEQEEDEVKRAEQPYLEEWRCFNEEIGDMALECEAVVFDALFDELVVDISSANATVVSGCFRHSSNARSRCLE